MKIKISLRSFLLLVKKRVGVGTVIFASTDNERVQKGRLRFVYLWCRHLLILDMDKLWEKDGRYWSNKDLDGKTVEISLNSKKISILKIFPTVYKITVSEREPLYILFES